MKYSSFLLDELQLRVDLDSWVLYGSTVVHYGDTPVEVNIPDKSKLSRSFHSSDVRDLLTVQVVDLDEVCVSRIANQEPWHHVSKASAQCVDCRILDYLDAVSVLVEWVHCLGVVACVNCRTEEERVHVELHS